jgi:hypothetical protein
MVSFADEIDSNALVANPFLDLPILTAARAFLAEREFLAKPPENMAPMTVQLMRQVSSVFESSRSEIDQLLLVSGVKQV